MIPNLKDLPPIPLPESPLKRLVRPLLGGLLMVGMLGGLLWLYVAGIKETTRQEVNIIQGLQGVGADLWMYGKAAEIRFMEDELPKEIARLRDAVGFDPEIVVVLSTGQAGRPRSTHELMYMKGNRTVLSVSLWVDETEGLVDVVDFQTSPGFDGEEGLRGNPDR